ncbi:glycosyltransferase [Kosakonia sp. ML.JS2a]|uniref:glycosyltransferase n=1 Tax=Kosakonia sp. ML.JS2a TaxID=2980557 RepID=UPI0021D9831B|nr:glycosyltransferase [Kosakonia sp. ML.JS2a]UXY12633.1 glycosyltransferase [Kosakonia sp. ML.JS2a]
MTDNHKYSREQLGNSEDSLFVVSSFINDGSEVLDIGCYEGALGKYLISEKGCVVDGIEYEDAAAAVARQFYRDVKVADLNSNNIFSTLNTKYDCIIFADVLEHLYDPAMVLKNAMACLKESGKVIISVPNIGYQGVITELANGEFYYRQTGILDKTHLRFFTRKSLKRLITNAGLHADIIKDIRLINNDSEFSANVNISNAGRLNQLIDIFPDVNAYQFVAQCSFAESKAKTVEKKAQSQSGKQFKYRAKLYWRDHDGMYSDADSIEKLIPYSDQNATISLDLPKDRTFEEIRIDLCEEPMCCYLFNITIKSHADEILQVIPLTDIQAQDENTKVCQLDMDKAVIYCFHNDPAFTFRVDSSKLKGTNAKVDISIGALSNTSDISTVIDDLVQSRQQLLASTSWKITKPLRFGVRVVKKVKRLAINLLRQIKALNLRAAPLLVVRTIRKEGLSATLRKIFFRLKRLGKGNIEVSYADFIAHDEKRNQYEIEKIARSFTKENSPLISVLLPVYKSDLKFLQECIDSVFSQSYSHWELCICDDASNSPELTQLLNKYATDSRVKIICNDKNSHISHTTNQALGLATGQYIVLLDHDDLLHTNALHYLAKAINDNQYPDIIYTDEDHVTTTGERKAPFLKPDWSPALLYSQNYIGHITCISRNLINQIGGFTVGLEGAQDYDLVLRASAIAENIIHIPRILYHWREHPQSTAMNADSKPYAHDAGKMALTNYFKTAYPNNFIEVADGEHLFTYEPKFRVNPEIKISLIIPIRDKISLLADLIESINAKTTWTNYEIIIIDNGSVEEQTHNYLAELTSKGNCKVLRDDSPFNWSKLNNNGASLAEGDVFIFLNNDTLVITPGWLENLASWALLPDVGVVGPQLLYEDGTIQHAGVVVGMFGWAEHVFKGQSNAHHVGPFVSPALNRNVLALTGACHAISREVFTRLGGYDEEFEICGSDIELCIRAYNAGYQNVYLAQTKLFHLESKSRSSFVPECDFLRSRIKYEPYRTEAYDPFYNINLDKFNNKPTIKL